MLTDLTEREEELIAASQRGDWLVCDDPDDPADAIRGEVLRELLLGKHGELDPRGVQVQKARITGNLDLNNVQAVVGLNLSQ